MQKYRNSIALAWAWDEQIALATWPDNPEYWRIGIADTLPNGQIWLQEGMTQATPVKPSELKYDLGLMHNFWATRQPWMRFITQHFDVPDAWSILRVWAACQHLLGHQNIVNQHLVDQARKETTAEAESSVYALTQDRPRFLKIQQNILAYNIEIERIYQSWNTLGQSFSQLSPRVDD